MQNIPENIVASTGFAVLRFNEKATARFVYELLFSENVQNQMLARMEKGSYPSINEGDVASLKIPLPPLSVQKEIVERVEGYQRLIDGAKQVVANFKPSINLNPDWQMVELGSLTTESIRSGAGIVKSDIVDEGNYRFVNIKNLFDGNEIKVAELPSVADKDYSKSLLKDGDLLFVRVSLKEEGVGYVNLFKSKETNVVYGDNIFRLTPNQNIADPKFLLYLLRLSIMRNRIIEQSMRANVTSINQTSLKSLQVALPPLEEQKQIVAHIEREQSLVNANKELIAIYEQKIKDEINKLWEE